MQSFCFTSLLLKYLCAAQAEAGDQGVEVVLLLLGVVLAPAFGTEARPGRVAKEAAAGLAQELRLLHLQPAVQLLCPRSHTAGAHL